LDEAAFDKLIATGVPKEREAVAKSAKGPKKKAADAKPAKQKSGNLKLFE
jgi:hypothetical protein